MCLKGVLRKSLGPKFFCFFLHFITFASCNTIRPERLVSGPFWTVAWRCLCTLLLLCGTGVLLLHLYMTALKATFQACLPHNFTTSYLFYEQTSDILPGSFSLTSSQATYSAPPYETSCVSKSPNASRSADACTISTPLTHVNVMATEVTILPRKLLWLALPVPDTLPIAGQKLKATPNPLVEVDLGTTQATPAVATSLGEAAGDEQQSFFRQHFGTTLRS